VRPLLIEHNLYPALQSLTSALLRHHPDKVDLLFTKAYALAGQGDPDEAEKYYRRVLDLAPDSPGSLSNLSLILANRGLLDDAIQLSEQALKLSPDDDIIRSTLERHREARAAAAKRPRKDDPATSRSTSGTTSPPESASPARPAQPNKVDESAQQGSSIARGYSLKVPRNAIKAEQWSQLDVYKQRILKVVHEFGGKATWQQLSRATSIEIGSLRGHCYKLVGTGLLTYLNDGIRLEADIESILATTLGSGVRTRHVTEDSDSAVKPLFNSMLEEKIYHLFTRRFPNMLVFPNVALQSIFAYEEMRLRLPSNIFNYYLKAHVDICVISTVDYKPQFAFEIDSFYHDSEQAQEKDRTKDLIFLAGKLDFFRIRVEGQATEREIQEHIYNQIDSSLAKGRRVD
jgi:hypothetical protein